MTEIISRNMTADEKAERAKWAAGAYARELTTVKQIRRALYTTTSDPVFFKSQRGEATEQDWLDAIAAIDTANPYPVQAP